MMLFPFYNIYLYLLTVVFFCSFISSILQRLDADHGVQPHHKNCVEFSQAPADGKDFVHSRLPCRPQDIKESKGDHLLARAPPPPTSD